MSEKVKPNPIPIPNLNLSETMSSPKHISNLQLNKYKNTRTMRSALGRWRNEGDWDFGENRTLVVQLRLSEIRLCHFA